MSSNVFIALPRPAGNGVGAAVSASTLGAQRTIVVGSSGGVYEPVVTIEASSDGTSWSPLATFNGADTKTIIAASTFLRMNVSNFFDGVVPTVDVGAPLDTVTIVVLPAPASSISGTALDTSGLGSVKTVQVTGAYGGTVNVEISNDGPTGPWAAALSFQPGGPTLQSFTGAAEMMRVTRVGIPQVNSVVPGVTVAAGTSSGGGGSSGQTFAYTATGAEGATFNVPLPAARPNTNYAAVAVDGGRIDGTMSFFVCPIAQYTTTQIQVLATQSPAAGDVILIEIQDRTS